MFYNIFSCTYQKNIVTLRAFSLQSKKQDNNTLKHSKYIVSPLRFFLLLAVPFLFTAQPVWSAAVTTPANLPTYYNSYIDGKSGTDLFTGIHNVAKVGYSSLSYSGLWTAYNTTDVYPTGHDKAGKIWDLYSYCTSYTPGTDQDSGSGSTEGTVYNREHSIPKSWFGGSTNNNTPGTDIFHVYPTDKIVNGKRSNYAFGEVTVGNATYSSNKGCGGFSSTDLEGYSRLGSGSAITISNTIVSKTGSTTQSPTSSPVFEPLSEYKGDLARSYFGTMIRWANDYAAFTTGDGSCMFSGTYTEAGHWGLTPYGVALLMKWHREDPVSQKEIDRNNGIQSTQGNRNPFIDYPCLAEYLWGEHAGETFSLSTAVGSFENGFTPGVSDGCACAGPTITSPTGTINIGTTNTSTSIVKDITIQGVNLASGSLTLSITGTNSAYFSLSTTSISNVNAEAGYNVTVTYNPTANGSHTATLNISGCGLTSPHTVTLTGTCTIVYTATWMADGSTFGTSTAASGASPELPAPNPSNCTSSRVFVGWTATSGYTGSSAPADLFTTTAPTITTDKTFYAVYADATTSGSGSVSTTVSMSTFTTVSGNVDDDSNVSYAAAQGTATTAPAINSNVIRIYQNGGLLTITANNGKKLTSITIGSSMATTVTYAIDGGSASSNQSITAGNTFTLNSINATSVVFTCTGTDKNSRLYLNNLSVTYSGSGTTTTYNNYSTMCSACTPVATTASFASSTKATTVGGTVTNTFTTNSNATVSYASSNTSVATVASDGTVTPLSAGTTTITATVPANTCFTGGASASYTLTVYNFNATAATDVTCSSFTANWTSAGAASYSLDVYQATTGSITVSRDTTIAYDFTGGMYWTAKDVSGTSDIWKNDPSYGNVGKGQSGTASESWLISPEMDFSDVTTASLSMNHTVRYGETSQLSVKYSIDGGSTWNNATLSNWGDVNNWTFVDATADLSATCGYAHVKLAFVYTCTTSSYSTWEIKTLTISGKYNKTTSTSSITHVSGYPKDVTGTSASVTTLDPTTTYYYTVTPSGGSVSNQIEVTTPACTCTYTITATTDDSSQGTVSVTTP